MGTVTLRWSGAGSRVAVASDARSSVAIEKEQRPEGHRTSVDVGAHADGEGLNGYGGRLFVSHASSDVEIAKEVASMCEERGIATWLAERDIRVGENYAVQIYNAIVGSSYIVVLMSPESVASPHVRREVNVAIDNGVPVLPMVVTRTPDFMATLPSDWKYWLGVVQAIPFADADTAVESLEALLAN